MNGTASLRSRSSKTRRKHESHYLKQLLNIFQHQLIISEEPFQFQVALLDYNDYVGRIGIGRVFRGTMEVGQQVSLMKVRWYSVKNSV